MSRAAALARLPLHRRHHQQSQHQQHQYHHLRNYAPPARLTPPRARRRRRPPLPAAQIVPSLSFSNPFQQYAGGVIPGWEYGGEATLASDYITLTPATPNKVGWVWAAEPAALGSWEVQLEMHIGGAAQRGAGGGMAFWCEDAPRDVEDGRRECPA